MIKNRKFNINNFKIIDIEQPSEGRCVNCEAKDHCGMSKNFLQCKCNMTQHYINIKKLRQAKLSKIHGNNIQHKNTEFQNNIK